MKFVAILILKSILRILGKIIQRCFYNIYAACLPKENMIKQYLGHLLMHFFTNFDDEGEPTGRKINDEGESGRQYEYIHSFSRTIAQPIFVKFYSLPSASKESILNKFSTNEKSDGKRKLEITSVDELASEISNESNPQELVSKPRKKQCTEKQRQEVNNFARSLLGNKSVNLNLTETVKVVNFVEDFVNEKNQNMFETPSRKKQTTSSSLSVSSEGSDNTAINGYCHSNNVSPMSSLPTTPILTQDRNVQQINGRNDQETNGRDDQETNGRDDQETNGRDDQETNGRDDQETNGRDDQQTNGRDDQQINGRNVQQINGRNDQETNGRDDQETR